MQSLFAHRTIRALAVGLLLMALVIPIASAMPSTYQAAARAQSRKNGPELSGVYDIRDADAAPQGNAGLLGGGANLSDASLNTNVTGCPQAGLKGNPEPLNSLVEDSVERVAERGDDIRVNQDYSCFPQDETTIEVNPRHPRNIVVGANDYRLTTGSSGFYATTDGGKSWYDGIIPFPSVPAAQSRGEGFVLSGGDPVVAFDRDGVAYYATIAFFRGDDTNGIFVSRSTNGGFTWSRGCVPSGTTDANAFCVAFGDVRLPGDGRVTFAGDTDNTPNRSVPFNDKEWMTTGPRPAGVSPQCFAPISKAPTACTVVGVDRIYVTWTKFTATDSQIYMSFSDDQGRSWAPEKPISGSAPFCSFGVGTTCDANQFSAPTVSPATGHLYVSFENFNTLDENQYLVVRSTDGGATFSGPFFVSPVFDTNFPRAGAAGGRPDCTNRGQQGGRIVYTNSCFRSNALGNIVVDKRGGAFADDLYLVFSDNRNGTRASSNADIFLFKSTNGGASWIGPTRVNNDPSNLTVSRECAIGSTGCFGNFGNDQWWPWVDIGEKGELNVVFHDRRLDTNSVAHEWADLGSRQRPGNYLVWQWGAQCRVTQADSSECLAPGAAVIPQPVAPVDPGDDPVPGQGPAYLGTLRNIQISDIPSNFDYTFRAGIFAGDYENVTVHDGKAYTSWTDARNGRSSRDQPGRNPICEQSDAYIDIYNAANASSDGASVSLDMFLVTPCSGTKP